MHSQHRKGDFLRRYLLLVLLALGVTLALHAHALRAAPPLDDGVGLAAPGVALVANETP